MSLERAKVLKEGLRSRKKIFGAWTSLGHPQITEIFTHSGVDFVGIDIEHSTISLEQSQRIIAASQAGGSLCLPRIASHNMEAIKRLADSGADGIIVPMVSNPSEVESLIQWVKYPPVGRRSYGIARAQEYGFDFESYAAAWNASSSLIIQIESIEGVNNIERLLDYEHVDAVMIGPYDLSGSLGIPGQLEDVQVRKACQKVIDACAKFGKGCGTQVIEPDPKSVATKHEEGYSFIVLSSDIFMMWKWAARMKELIVQTKKSK